MEQKKLNQNSGIFLLVLVAAVLCCLALRLQGSRQETAAVQEPDMHFVLLLPKEQESDIELAAVLSEMEQGYNLKLETYYFSTVSEQKEFLRILSVVEPQGVLLWPVAAAETMYTQELQALRNNSVPVVLVGRDMATGERDSFIGGGITSDKDVLQLGTRNLTAGQSFMVGNSMGTGNDRVVELVQFSKYGILLDRERISDKELRELAADPPEGWRATGYIRLEGAETKATNLRRYLREMLLEEEAPQLILSLDPDISLAAVAAKRDVSSEIHLYCYGALADFQNTLKNGEIDGLISSKNTVSMEIGIRYLRDLHRGFWVPGTMDSGIDLRTVEVVE